MAAIVTTSIVINFEAKTGHILRAEVDDRPTSAGGFNNGETTFSPGDNPVFLLYKSSNVTVTGKITSEGTLATLSNPVFQKTEQLQFANANSAELSYPYVSGFTVVRKSPKIPDGATINGGIVKLPSVGTGILEVSYFTTAEAIRVSGAAGDLPVVVYIEGTST